MVDFDTQDREKDNLGSDYITDVSGYRRITRNVEKAIDECRGNDDRLEIPTTIELEGPVIVYGSYARGTAKKGESDLDVIIPITNMGDEVGVIMSNITEACINDHEDIIIEGFESWFDGADVTVITNNMKWIMALRFAIGRDEGKGPVVYDMEKDWLIDKDEIVENIVEQIYGGDIPRDEIDMMELKASPLDDYNIQLIRDAFKGKDF